MKRYSSFFTALVAVMTLFSGFLISSALPGLAQEDTPAAGGSTIYLISNEVPPLIIGRYPPEAEKETVFLKELGQQLHERGPVYLTIDSEDADYTVELHCKGILYCQTLQLEFYSPDRQFLSAVKIPGRRWPWSSPGAESYATPVASTIVQQIDAMKTEGRYGVYTDKP